MGWEARQGSRCADDFARPGLARFVDGKWHVIEERAAIVRRIFEQTVDSVGQHAIAEQLNREGVPVFGEGRQQGKRWHRSYIVKILTSLTVVGTLVPHLTDYVDGRKVRTAQEPIEGYYPAVVGKALFEQVQLLSATRSPLRGRHAAGEVQNIIGGLAWLPKVRRQHDTGEQRQPAQGGLAQVGLHHREGRGRLPVSHGRLSAGRARHRGEPWHGLVHGQLGISADAPASAQVLREQLTRLDAKIGEHEGRLSNLLSAIAERRRSR